MEEMPRNGVVRYKECLKNHAAALGGNATDGCGEFMPSSGEQGSLEALKCSACNCHRNFHKKEIDYSASGGNATEGCGEFTPSSSKQDEDEDKDAAMDVKAVEKGKKRFKTKFSEEQKQKMMNFVEKYGWKMLDDSFVKRFCQEIGIEKRVFKVWIQNNKHHFSAFPKEMFF